MDRTDSERLEALIDAHGLSLVMAELAEICHGKAEHLATNWQDTRTAKLWSRDAERIATVSNKLEAA